MTLKPGDLILTGTPPGVGVFRKPPEFLKVRKKILPMLTIPKKYDIMAFVLITFILNQFKN